AIPGHVVENPSSIFVLHLELMELGKVLDCGSVQDVWDRENEGSARFEQPISVLERNSHGGLHVFVDITGYQEVESAERALGNVRDVEIRLLVMERVLITELPCEGHGIARPAAR